LRRSDKIEIPGSSETLEGDFQPRDRRSKPHIRRSKGQTPLKRYWQVRDLLMWDNCTVQHLATFDYQWPRHRRLMQRVNVGGSATF